MIKNPVHLRDRVINALHSLVGGKSEIRMPVGLPIALMKPGLAITAGDGHYALDPFVLRSFAIEYGVNVVATWAEMFLSDRAFEIDAVLLDDGNGKVVHYPCLRLWADDDRGTFLVDPDDKGVAINIGVDGIRPAAQLPYRDKADLAAGIARGQAFLALRVFGKHPHQPPLPSTESSLRTSPIATIDMHPPKLLIMFPIYTPVEYRRQLTALDDALVVHHHADGRFQLDLRPMIKLTTRGQRSFGAALRQLAADIEAGYCVIIVERDQYLADLERLARANATSRDRDAIERAVQIVMERIDRQVFDNLFDSPREYLVGRMLTARQPRRTKANKHETPGLNCMFGIPTPRTELLWHTLRHQWCSPRIGSAGRVAWYNWCRANRPPLPTADAE